MSLWAKASWISAFARERPFDDAFAESEKVSRAAHLRVGIS
jgi:hypothetical protein